MSPVIRNMIEIQIGEARKISDLHSHAQTQEERLAIIQMYADYISGNLEILKMLLKEVNHNGKE